MPKSGLSKAERASVNRAESTGVVRAAKRAYKHGVEARHEIVEQYERAAIKELDAMEEEEKVVKSKATTAKVRKAAASAERAAEAAEEAIKAHAEASPKKVTGAKRKAKEAMLDAVHEAAGVHVGHSEKRKAARAKARAASRSPPRSRSASPHKAPATKKKRAAKKASAAKQEVPIHFTLWRAAKAAYFDGKTQGRVDKGTPEYDAVQKIFVRMKREHALAGGEAVPPADAGALGGGGSDAE